MKKAILICAVALFSLSSFAQKADKDGWIPLWDGKTLNGWKASENPESFSIEDGVIKVDGPRAHLFYVGAVMNHDFKNFEFKVQVKNGAQS